MTVRRGVNFGSKWFSIIAMAFVLLSAGCSTPPEELLADATSQVADKKFRTAVITLKNLLQDDPENIEGRLLLARVSLALGDPLAAEKELTHSRDLGADASRDMALYFRIQLAIGKFANILQLLSDEAGVEGLTSVQALNFRGEALLGLGSAIEAEKSFREAAALDSTSPEAQWGIAAALAATGRLDEASDILALLSAEHADFARGQVLSGQVHLRNGELALAEIAFAKGADLAAAMPDRLIQISALSGLAESQLSQNELDSTEQSIRRLGNIASQLPVTRFLNARLAAARLDYELAANELEAVLKVSPDNLAALMLYGSVLVARGDNGQAEVVLSQVVARAPENLAARRLLAAAQVGLAEHKAAVETIGPLLKSGDRDPNLALFAGQAMLRSGATNDAIGLLEKTLASDPENIEVKMSLAAAYLQAERTDDAIQMAQSVPGNDENYRRELLLALAYTAAHRDDAAEQRVEDIVARFGDDAQALLLTADFYFRRQNPDKALGFYERILKLDANNVQARLGLGRIFIAADDIAAAGEQFEEVLKVDPDSLPALTALANIASTDGDLEKSQQLLLRAVKASDRAALPRLMLANLYQRQGNALRAEQTVQEAARLGADNAVIQLGAGELLVAIGKYREAMPYLRTATELGPDNTNAWFGLARAQLALGEVVDARTSLNKSLDIDPNALKPLLAMALLEVRDGNDERALQIAARLKEAYRDSSAPLNLEASIYMRQQRYEEAAGLFRQAFELEPSGVLARRSFQAGLEAGTDEPDAILRHWIDDNPDDVGSLFFLAQNDGSDGDWAEAGSLYSRVLENDADNFVALNNLAWAYFQTGDERAESTARKAYALRPDIPSVADTLGWILIRKGNLTEGGALVEEALQASPDAKNMRYHLAYVKNATGVSAESVSILKELLANDAAFTERAAAEALLKSLEDPR